MLVWYFNETASGPPAIHCITVSHEMGDINMRLLYNELSSSPIPKRFTMSEHDKFVLERLADQLKKWVGAIQKRRPF